MSGISAIMGAMKYLPASAGLKLLEKVNPKFKNYFTQAAAYGFDANNALDYLNERFENEQTQSFKGQLAQGEAQGTLRPDEQVAKQQISRSEIPGKVLRSTLAFGGAALTGGLPGLAAQGIGEAAQGMQPQAQQPQPGSREEALLAYNEKNKKKKLYEELKQEFGQYYPEEEQPISQPQQMQQQQPASRGASSKDELTRLTAQGLQILRGLKGR